ncbi:MAG: orotate phosphoribosyltransferase [Actinomycetota bacterium]
MNEAEILAVLEDKGAVMRGHFRLSSGRHSDVFAQKFRVLEHPGIAARFGQELAAAFEGEFDVVASPAVGAVVLGFSTALAGGARFIFSERSDDAMAFRRGFEIQPHERVLVIEDVVTTGGSAAEVVQLVKAAGGDCVGIGTLIDRVDPSRPAELGAALKSLVKLESRSWDPGACPLCAEDVPLDDPGSRRI